MLEKSLKSILLFPSVRRALITRRHSSTAWRGKNDDSVDSAVIQAFWQQFFCKLHLEWNPGIPGISVAAARLLAWAGAEPE